MRKKNTRKGFTIVELVIVIAVIGILAAVLIPTFSNVIKNANESSALQEARNTLTEYLIDNAEKGDENFIITVSIGSGDSAKTYFFAVVDSVMQETAYTAKEGNGSALTAFTNLTGASAGADVTVGDNKVSVVTGTTTGG